MRNGKNVWVLTGLLLLAVLPVTAQIELQLDCEPRALRTDPVHILVQAVVPETTPLGALEATVSWDTSLLSLAAVAPGAFGRPTFRQQDGQLTLASFDASGTTGTVTLARLTLHDRQSTTGETQVTLAAAEITAADDFAALTAESATCIVPLPEAATPLIRLHIVGEQQVLAGDRLQVRLVADMVPGVELGAIDASLSWDPSLFGLVGVEGAFGAFQQRPRNADDGSWSFTAFAGSGGRGSVELATLTFETRTDTAGIGDMTIATQTLTGLSTFADLLPHAALAPYVVEIVRDEVARPPARVFLHGTAETTTGSTVELALAARMPAGVALGAVDLALVWDPDQLELVEFRDGAFAPMTTNLADASVGLLSTTGFRPEGAEGEIIVGHVVMRALRDGATASVSVRVGEITAARTFADLGADAVPEPFQLSIAAENQAPVATIDVPLPGLEVVAGAELTLQGRGTDPEQGPLDGAMLHWSSNVQGDLGTGAVVPLRPTQAGRQVITLTATDAQGAQGTATIIIQVVAANQPPTARIAAPATGHRIEAGQSLTLRGTGSDPEDGTLAGSSLRWSSSLDGDLGTGLTRTVTLVAIGTHVITMTATDGQGLTHAATTLVTVVEPEPAVPGPVVPEPVEPDPVPPGVTLLPLGERADGELTATGLAGRQSYIMDVTSLQAVRLTLRSNFDGYLRLYEPVESTRHFASRRVRVSSTGRARTVLDRALEPGRYRVEVGSIGDGQLGAYSLTLGPPVAPGLPSITIGESVSAQIRTTGREGRQSWVLPVGTSRRVRFVATADFRPRVSVFSTATGAPVIAGIAPEGSTQIDFTFFLPPLLYRVEVSAVGDEATGSFRLEIPTSLSKPALAEDAAAPAWQTFPNPFNSSIAINYRVPTAGAVRLQIYNMLGQRVRTLVQADQPAGAQHHLWDGLDDSHRAVASGVYLLQLTTPVGVQRQRITLLR